MDPAEVARTACDTSDPLRALAATASLRRLADMLEAQHVEAAWREGHGWSEMAQALGVTRQAVHKKYARRLPLDARERNPR